MTSTRRGVATIFLVPPIQLAVGALLFVALLYGWRDLAVLTSTVLCLGLGVRLWAAVSLSGVTCHSTVDKERSFPGEPVTLLITLKNKKLVPIWLRLEIPFRSPLPSSFLESVLKRQQSLLWYQEATWQWDLAPTRRGVHRIGPPRLVAGDLFDFCRRAAQAEGAHEVLVYPKRVSLRSFPLPRRDFFGVPGPKSPVHDPVFLLGTREYQQGQPAKHIHWKASARHCRLQEKVFESTHHEKVLLVLDVASFAKHGAEEDFERTLEVLASLATTMERQGHSVGLTSNGVPVGGGPAATPVARSRRQLSAILEILARLSMSSDRGILDVLRTSRALTWGTTCLYFADRVDDTVAAAKEYFHSRKAAATCFVSRVTPSPEAPIALGLDSLRVEAGVP